MGAVKYEAHGAAVSFDGVVGTTDRTQLLPPATLALATGSLAIDRGVVPVPPNLDDG